MWIYGIFNKKNGKVLIGQTIRSVDIRWKEHRTMANTQKHENPHFQHAWNKYGAKSFKLEVLHKATSQNELDYLEEYYRQGFAPDVYNLRTGGHFGSTLAPETLAKMVKNQKWWIDKNHKFLSEIAKLQ